VDHGPGLAATRPRHHQSRALKVEDGLALGLVQGGEQGLFGGMRLAHGGESTTG